MQLVNNRYAEALIEVSEENSSTTEVLNNLTAILKLFKERTEFYSLLVDPLVQVDSKKKAIRNVFEGRVEGELLNFLMLLVDKSRLKNIGGILAEYARLADERKDILNMEIISASYLEDVQIDKIKEKYRSLYNKTDVKAKFTVDKGLIGGVRIQIGDMVIDDSIKARLMGLKEIMMK